MNYRYRGFDCLIREADGGFEAIILNEAKPIQVVWNGRVCWHKPARAKNMAAQFIKFSLCWTPQETVLQ